MYVRTVVIGNPIGLHARPATLLIQKANEFSSNLWLEKEERRVNAKSLLGVLSLGVGKDEEIQVMGDGFDETVAVDTLYDLIASDFTGE